MQLFNSVFLFFTLLCLIVGVGGISRGLVLWEKIHKMGGSLLSDFGVIFPKTPSKMKVLVLFQKNFIKWVGDYKMLLG